MHIYDADLLCQAHEAAVLERGGDWIRALTIGLEWLGFRSTPVIEPTDDEHVLIVVSTNGKRYTVDREGATCTCPAYQEPLLAGEVEKARPCKHRGAVIVHSHYMRLRAQTAIDTLRATVESLEVSPELQVITEAELEREAGLNAFYTRNADK